LESFPGSVAVSAVTGDGIEELLQAVSQALHAASHVYTFFLPYDRGDITAFLHREGEIISEIHEEQGVRIQVYLDGEISSSMKKFLEVQP
jgi:GTPase